MPTKSPKERENEGARRFKSAPLHNSVQQVRRVSENRSKTAGVRAICDPAKRRVSGI
jgi:hypothetical protein